MNKNIVTVVVTYNPDMKQLEETIHSIINQVSQVIIVDNGSTKFLFKNIDNLIIINLGKNYGIAYAQNRGIEVVERQNAGFVLLSDQDTIYPYDFVSKMVDIYENYKQKECIGAITPIFYDKNRKCNSTIMITKFSAIVPDKGKIYYISHAISSGSLIPIKSLNNIGGMREDMFIDYVDNEWCWRAQKCGFRILSVPAISVEHELGAGIKRLGNRNIILRNRKRYYYMLRNGFYIIFHTNILKLHEVILFFRELFIKTIGICLIEKKPIPLIYRAVHDGITATMYEMKGRI
jgi:rhamnosyltransferase